MKIFLPLLLISIFSSSCVTLYKPNAINSPELSERHQFRGGASVGLLGCGVGNGSGAYSVTKRIAITGSIMFHAKNSEYSAPKSLGLGRHNQFYAEAGAGYFKTYDRMKRFFVQYYGGAGLGYSDNYFSQPDASHIKMQCSYHTLYVQPGVYYTDKYYDAAFDLRITYLNLFGITSTSSLYRHQTFYLAMAEPTFTFRIGSKTFRPFLQTGYTLPLVDRTTYMTLNTAESKTWQSLMKFSLGFNLSFREDTRNSQKFLNWKNK